MDCKKISAVLESSGLTVFEYLRGEDKLIIYNNVLKPVREIENYISYLENDTGIYPEDKWKLEAFFRGRLKQGIDVRIAGDKGLVRQIHIEAVVVCGEDGEPDVCVGSIRDVTIEKRNEKILENQARKDLLTGLYNHFLGKELINEYLSHKNPYDSCGLIVVDIDYFKNANDIYGHLFGDKVLSELAHLLELVFDKQDIIMRSGGDEFVILAKSISNDTLVRKVRQFIEDVQKMVFAENDYIMTCSAGVCFLPENMSGYTYDQLFENADWALYRAKEKGKNGYVFCDTLNQFEFSGAEDKKCAEDIDARYLHNDIISTAFEVFEKMNSFDAAVRLLMRIIGIRFQLDRITIIHTDINENKTSRRYQWLSEGAEEVLNQSGSFTKEDFITLFHSYDEYDTTVLQCDNMKMYSEDGARLLMQGGAKTVVYAAMYCEGKYTGAISYVVCGNKRYWSKQSRCQFGELTKIISAHLAKNLAMNACSQGTFAHQEYDSLTGLISYCRFREAVERIIVGSSGTSYVMMYCDFVNFKEINQKYGYQTGDKLLEDFANYVIEKMNGKYEVYFTRVVSDHFILFKPWSLPTDSIEAIKEAGDVFVRQQMGRFEGIALRLRIGICMVPDVCHGVSAAVDAANYARMCAAGTGLCQIGVVPYEN